METEEFNGRVEDDKEMTRSSISQEEMEFYKDRKTYQKFMFYTAGGSAIVLFIIAILFIICTKTITTLKVTVFGLLLSVSTVLTLSLMKYVYDGKKSDTPQPTLMLNVGKELASVIKETIVTIVKKN